MMDGSGTRKRDAATGSKVAATAFMVALATTACSKDRPTEPTGEATLAATAIMSASGRVAVGALLDDASTRLMPSLGDVTAQAQLRGHLDDLAAALEGNSAAKARRQIALARKVIAALAESPDVADLAVLRITLDQVEAQLDATSPLQQP